MLYAVNYNHGTDIDLMRTHRAWSERRVADHCLPSTLTLGSYAHVAASLVRSPCTWGALLQL